MFQQAPEIEAIPNQTQDPAWDQVQFHNSAEVQILYQVKIAVIQATAQAYLEELTDGNQKSS